MKNNRLIKKCHCGDIISCPFCDKIILKYNENMSPIVISEDCSHLVLEEEHNFPEYTEDNNRFPEIEVDIPWWRVFLYVDPINSFIGVYKDSKGFNDLKKMSDDLRIKKWITYDKSKKYNDFFKIEFLEDEFPDDIIIIEDHENISYDTHLKHYECGLDITQYIFIRDKKKIQWIFDESKVLYDRLDEYDKNNDKHLQLPPDIH
tara:strand:+ start:304 stop:915 length:612 start_codon:yes stop_codon:yes gene_type:complete